MNDLEKYEFIEKIYGCSYFNDTDIILKLLSDSDECVRMEMIEACYACEQEVICEKLFQMLHITNGLEKGYILLTLSYIYQNNESKIIDILKDNICSLDVYEKLDAFVGLIILGHGCYLKEVLKFLESPEYNIRCAVLNLLSELIENGLIEHENIIIIKDAVAEISNKEKTKAVMSSIQHLLGVINQGI